MIEIPGKIPIRIQPFFWLLIALIGWLNSESVLGTLIWAGVITVSIIIHEFGHALSAVFFGQTAEIELVGFGGVTKRSGPTLKLWQEFIIVLNGPLAGFLLFLLAYQVNQWYGGSHSLTVGHYIIEITMYINLVWTALNLLPVLPLDGSHLVRIIFESLFGVRGIRWAALLSLGVAAVMAVVSFMWHLLIAGAFFLIMGFESYRAWSSLRGMIDEDTRSPLLDYLMKGEQFFNQKRFDEALPIFLSIREQVKKGKVFTMATQYAGHIYADQGHLDESYQFLSSIKKELPLNYLYLLLQVTFRLGKYEESISLGEQSFKENPTPEIALINALSYGALGQAHRSIGWLKGAVQSGLENLPTVLRRKEFDPIRLNPEFQAFLLAYK